MRHLALVIRSFLTVYGHCPHFARAYALVPCISTALAIYKIDQGKQRVQPRRALDQAAVSESSLIWLTFADLP